MHLSDLKLSSNLRKCSYILSVLDGKCHEEAYLGMCVLSSLLNCIDELMVSFQSRVTDLANLHTEQQLQNIQ
jgi:hypothetical protein